MIGKCSSLTHNKYKGEDISEGTFEYKGCWGCSDFEYNKDFPYYDTEEASKILNKSQSTIRNWIKKGKLEGKLFMKGRSSDYNSSWRKYFIKKESVDKLVVDNIKNELEK